MRLEIKDFSGEIVAPSDPYVIHELSEFNSRPHGRWGEIRTTECNPGSAGVYVEIDFLNATVT